MFSKLLRGIAKIPLLNKVVPREIVEVAADVSQVVESKIEEKSREAEVRRAVPRQP